MACLALTFGSLARWRHNDGDKRCAAERGRLASRAFLRRSGADETRTTREQRLQAASGPALERALPNLYLIVGQLNPTVADRKKTGVLVGLLNAHAGAQQEKTM